MEVQEVQLFALSSGLVNINNNLTNFPGKWQTPFKSESTKADMFYVNKYSSVKVPMMCKTEKVASMFDKSLSCRVLNLPYRGGAHMLVVMPEKEGNFDALEDGLSSELVASWLNKMKYRYKTYLQ